MLIRSIQGKTPRFGKRVFVAANAAVVGDVTLEDDVSIWYGSVLRGDIDWIRVGARSNLQDGVIVHVEHERGPTRIGCEVTVGHGAVLHGCTIGNGSLIGMRAVVLNYVEIGEQSVVAAGSVVREGFKVPPRSLVAGVPAVVKRPLTEDELARCIEGFTNYLGYKSRYLADGEDQVLNEPPREES